MTLVDLRHAELGVRPTCEAVGVSRATWYRRRSRASDQPPQVPTRSHPRRIGADERTRILAVLCEDRFADLTPRQVHAALLSEGTYLCSPSSMYRILRESRAIRERRRIASHPRHATPVLVATQPDQVWTWDITRLPASGGGHYCLYVAIDLYSRCVVAWKLARSESGAVARDFIHRAVLANGVDPAGLTVHADRGVPMTSEPLSELFVRLGIRKSHSRPRTSNDNAFSEAQLKTLKYGPAWPEGRMTYDQWRAWCPEAFHWYNHRHHHASIAHFTPAEVHTGRHLALREVRQRALDRAWDLHPERFVSGRPVAEAVPGEVWINRPEQEPANHVPQAAAS
jgi:transposase InsO family protein